MKIFKILWDLGQLLNDSRKIAILSRFECRKMLSIFYPCNVNTCSGSATRHCCHSRSSICHSGLNIFCQCGEVRCSVQTAACLSQADICSDWNFWGLLLHLLTVRWLLVSVGGCNWMVWTILPSFRKLKPIRLRMRRGEADSADKRSSLLGERFSESSRTHR